MMKTLPTIKAALLVIAVVLNAGVKAQNKKCEPDTNKMEFANFDVIVIEKPHCDEKTQSDPDTLSNHDKHEKPGGGSLKFSYWGGFYMGINGLLSSSGSTSLGKGNEFLQQDYSRSFTFGLNFIDVKFKIVPRHVGLTTGMGIQWNRYGFKNNYSLMYNNDSVYGIYDSTISFNKNKLTATYLQVPLLLEFKTGGRKSKAFHFWAGGIMAYKIGSRVRQEFEINGSEFSSQHKGHYQLNPLLFYASAGIGYGKHIRVFANYGLNGLFESGHGPSVIPFTIGLYLI